jgi:tetratricopeptide (TPR) repeat protein
MAENDAVFQEAVEALKEGKKARARELLTGLLKSDQNNATYWVWLSATMDTPKERIYCLQTAIKLDPDNAAAKRGLILHGALSADDSVPPFPVNRPRAWEQKLLLAHETPKPKGWAAVKASPVARIGGLATLAAVLIAALIFGFIIPAANRDTRPPTRTPGPSPTYTLTPTSVNATGQPAIIGTSASLSDLLAIPYTPTALYISLAGSPLTADQYRSAKLSYTRRDWDEVIRISQEIIRTEANSPAAYYLMGDAYRFKGDFNAAVSAYQSAIGLDPNYGPAYVGLARARLGIDPNTDVRSFLDDAIRLDANFGEAYLERAAARIRQNDIPGALSDLAQADTKLPGSPLVYYTLAQARLKEGDTEKAIQAAEKANELDVTHLPTYLLLGELYAQAGRHEDAVNALNIYIKYRSQDSRAYLLLGKMQYQNGDYEDAVKALDQATALDRNQSEPYLYRFLANVELQRGDEADKEIDTVLQFYPDSFDVHLAILRLHLLQKRNGSALLELDKTEALAENDEQKALVYYWGATVYERRNELQKAMGYWQKLLALPEEAMTAEMRNEARQHLASVTPATPTRTATVRTPTPTRTRTPTRTPTSTKTPTPTRTPSRTPAS